jgi:hypothetical protein
MQLIYCLFSFLETPTRAQSHSYASCARFVLVISLQSQSIVKSVQLEENKKKIINNANKQFY